MSEHDQQGDNVIALADKKQARPCPNCGKPATQKHRPFCSKRCADVDLGRWLNEDYRVPSDESPDQMEDDY